MAVGEEGHAAELLHHIGNGACIVGTQEGEVPQLTKVNLDGDKLVLEVDLLNAGTANEALELVELTLAAVRAQIGVIHLGRRIGCGALGDHGALFLLPADVHIQLCCLKPTRGRERPIQTSRRSSDGLRAQRLASERQVALDLRVLVSTVLTGFVALGEKQDDGGSLVLQSGLEDPDDSLLSIQNHLV